MTTLDTRTSGFAALGGFIAPGGNPVSPGPAAADSQDVQRFNAVLGATTGTGATQTNVVAAAPSIAALGVAAGTTQTAGPTGSPHWWAVLPPATDDQVASMPADVVQRMRDQSGGNDSIFRTSAAMWVYVHGLTDAELAALPAAMVQWARDKSAGSEDAFRDNLGVMISIQKNMLNSMVMDRIDAIKEAAQDDDG